MIYDTSVLLHCDCNFHIKTVPDVLDEIKSRNSKFLIEFRSIEVIEPDEMHIKIVEEAAAEKNRLSATDKKLIALALQLKESIITDDHEMQRIAYLLGLKVHNFHYMPAKALNRLR